MTRHISQYRFSFYRKPVQVDFSGGQITSDAGLLPLRAFDERHHLTREWAALARRSRSEDRVRHDALALLLQRVYQIVAGYEDANDADRLRHDPALQIVADQKLGDPLGSQPTLSRWENSPSARHLVRLNDACWTTSSVSAASKCASAVKSCSTSIPQMIPRTANINSVSLTVPIASTCTIHC